MKQELDSTAAEFFKMCQDGTDALLCLGIVLKVLICQRDTLHIVVAFHFIFMAQGTLLIEQLPYSV
jgi:hypothetical protein